MNKNIKWTSIYQLFEIQLTHILYNVFNLQKHRNTTACQLLGNLCTLALHDKEHPACALVFSLALRDRLDAAPHLFFSESQTNSVLKVLELLFSSYDCSLLMQSHYWFLYHSTSIQCYASFTGLYIQVSKCRFIFKITCSHKYWKIENAHACFHFWIQSTQVVKHKHIEFEYVL